MPSEGGKAIVALTREAGQNATLRALLHCDAVDVPCIEFDRLEVPTAELRARQGRARSSRSDRVVGLHVAPELGVVLANSVVEGLCAQQRCAHLEHDRAGADEQRHELMGAHALQRGQWHDFV